VIPELFFAKPQERDRRIAVLAALTALSHRRNCARVTGTRAVSSSRVAEFKVELTVPDGDCRGSIESAVCELASSDVKCQLPTAN
jgi:hypothetical protein